ncbi:MAG: DUF4397 domain-containing protein [Chloroflexota bacterium]
MKILKKIYVVWIAIMLIGIQAVANTSHVDAQNTSPMNTGQIRAVNALVGLGTVDVYLDDELIAFSLPAEQATPYLIFPTGKHTLNFRMTGSQAASAPVASQLFDLVPNESQTGIGYQTQFPTAASNSSGAALGEVLFLNDDRSPLQLGKTRVTAAHLAPGTPEKLSIAYPSRASLLYQISFAQPYGSVDIDAGLYSLAIVDADDPNLTILNRAGDKSLYANTLYTLVIVPDMTPSTTGSTEAPALAHNPRLFIISAPVEPPPDGIRLRIVHAAHNTAVLDIYVDERLVARRVNYGLATEYLGLTKYSHSISLRLFDTPADSQPLARADFIISADNKDQPTWSLLLLNASGDTSIALPVSKADPTTNTPAKTTFDTRGGPMMMVLIPDDVSQTRRGYSRIRLVHALDGFPALSLFALSPASFAPIPGGTPSPEPPATTSPALEFIRETIFGSEAGETEVRSGFYSELDIRIALSSSPIAALDNINLIDGLVYTFVIIGSNSGNPPLQVIDFADYGSGTQTNRLYSGVVRGALVNIRSGSRTGAPIITTLPKDWDVDVLSRSSDATWIRIRFNDPVTGSINEGWINADLVLVTRLGSVVNVRVLPEYTGIEQ